MNTKNLTDKILPILGILLLFAIVFWSTSSSSPYNSKSNVLHKQIYDFKFMNKLNPGKTFIKSKHKKLVILVSPTCPFCRSTLQSLSKIHSEYKDKINFFPTFNVKKDTNQIKSFMESNNFKLDYYTFSDTTILKNIRAVPTFLYLDEADRIVRLTSGGVESEEILRSMLDNYLNNNYSWRSKPSKDSAACSY